MPEIEWYHYVIVAVIIIGGVSAYLWHSSLEHIPNVKFVDNSPASQPIPKGTTTSILVNVKNWENKTIDNISIKTTFDKPDPNYLVINNPEITLGSMGAHASSQDEYVNFFAKNVTGSSITFKGIIAIYVGDKNTDSKNITFNVIP